MESFQPDFSYRYLQFDYTDFQGAAWFLEDLPSELESFEEIKISKIQQQIYDGEQLSNDGALGIITSINDPRIIKAQQMIESAEEHRNVQPLICLTPEQLQLLLTVKYESALEKVKSKSPISIPANETPMVSVAIEPYVKTKTVSVQTDEFPDIMLNIVSPNKSALELVNDWLYGISPFAEYKEINYTTFCSIFFRLFSTINLSEGDFGILLLPEFMDVANRIRNFAMTQDKSMQQLFSTLSNVLEASSKLAFSKTKTITSVVHHDVLLIRSQEQLDKEYYEKAFLDWSFVSPFMNDCSFEEYCLRFNLDMAVIDRVLEKESNLDDVSSQFSEESQVISEDSGPEIVTEVPDDNFVFPKKFRFNFSKIYTNINLSTIKRYLNCLRSILKHVLRFKVLFSKTFYRFNFEIVNSKQIKLNLHIAFDYSKIGCYSQNQHLRKSTSDMLFKIKDIVKNVKISKHKYQLSFKN